MRPIQDNWIELSFPTPRKDSFSSSFQIRASESVLLWRPKHQLLSCPVSTMITHLTEETCLLCPQDSFCVCPISEAPKASIFEQHSCSVIPLLRFTAHLGHVIVNAAPVITCKCNTCCVTVVNKYFLTPKLRHLRLSTKIPGRQRAHAARLHRNVNWCLLIIEFQKKKKMLSVFPPCLQVMTVYRWQMGCCVFRRHC